MSIATLRPPVAAPAKPAVLASSAILFACWNPQDPLQRAQQLAPALLPLGGRRMIERVIDTLVEDGCTRIDVVVRDHADAIQSLLGDGTRWGCTLHFHFLPPTTTTLPTLMRLTPDLDAHYRIASADSVVRVTTTGDEEWAAWQGNDWLGWARLSGRSFARLTPCLLERQSTVNGFWLLDRVNRVNGQVLGDARSTRGTLDAMRQVLANAQLDPSAPASRLPGQSPAAGLWIGQGSEIHPTARLIAPVWIGRHTLIRAHATVGPDCMVSDGCVIDGNATLRDSLILPGTYIGQGIELHDAVAEGARFSRSDLQVAVTVSDGSLLDSVAGQTSRPATPWLERGLAGLLWLTTLPFAAAWRECKTVRQEFAHLDPVDGSALPFPVRMADGSQQAPGHGPGSWRAHFSHVVHPALPAVIRGDLRLLGLQPRSAAELATLPDYWRRLYQTGRTGLLNEALLLGAEGAAGDMRFTGDALACEAHGWQPALRLLGAYARRVLQDYPTMTRL